MSKEPNTSAMADVQGLSDTRRIAIDRVGIKAKVATGAGANVGVVTCARNSNGSWGSVGAALVDELPRLAFVTLQAQQITLLEQSYAQLKESIYGGLVLQTRLKPYLDEIVLLIDEDGLRLDFTSLEVLMGARFAEDPANAVIDRLDLLEYAGELLTPGGWEAFGQIDAWLSLAEQRADWEARLRGGAP